MKITSQIYQVGGSSESHPSDASIYLIKNGENAALVDAGTGRGHQQVMNNIGIPPKKIQYLFITHCHYDHIGGAQQIREVSGCSIVAHELDASFMEKADQDVTGSAWYGTSIDPINVDIKVKGEEEHFSVGDIDVAFFHAPGHSPGSSILTAVSDDMLVLFGQDVHGPLNEVLMSNREDYVKSLEFMISLEADILCEGHFGVYVGKDKVQEFIESFL
ncbi:MAG: MBL fold metallo-hydrolase [Spirochaetota bacterium]|nr:MBL fold metallo-hydrolase [Spirochaetota bacterium]